MLREISIDYKNKLIANSVCLKLRKEFTEIEILNNIETLDGKFRLKYIELLNKVSNYNLKMLSLGVILNCLEVLNLEPCFVIINNNSLISQKDILDMNLCNKKNDYMIIIKSNNISLDGIYVYYKNKALRLGNSFYKKEIGNKITNYIENI